MQRSAQVARAPLGVERFGLRPCAPVQVADRQFPLASKLNFINCIRGFLNGDVVAIPQTGANFCLFCFQSRSVFF